MFKRLAIGLMIIGVIGLTGCDNSKKTESDKVEVDKVVEKEEKKIGNKYESLSDEDIKEAIEEGKKGNEHFIQSYLEKYKLEYLDGDESIVYYCGITTPYSGIVEKSASSKIKYQELEIDEAREQFDIHKNKIATMIGLIGKSLDFNKSIHAVVKQDEVVIQPLENMLSGGFAEFSGDILSEYPYTIMENVVFDIADIDTNKEAELIIVYDSMTEIKYKIDFSKYK